MPFDYGRDTLGTAAEIALEESTGRIVSVKSRS